jgi:hypothetical protein
MDSLVHAGLLVRHVKNVRLARALHFGGVGGIAHEGRTFLGKDKIEGLEGKYQLTASGEGNGDDKPQVSHRAWFAPYCPIP